jgi:hypothetical protein
LQHVILAEEEIGMKATRVRNISTWLAGAVVCTMLALASAAHVSVI